MPAAGERRGGTVPVHDVVTVPEEPTGEDRAHGAQSEETDASHQLFQIVLRLQNSRMPSAASSRPIPESFTPPKGSSG